MDLIEIKNLLVRGIVGINPEERVKKQDVLVNVVMAGDTAIAAASDNIDDSINYRTVSKAIIAHIENGEPMLVERLAEELADLVLETDKRVEWVRIGVEKPGALRYAESVGITIERSRAIS